MAWVILVYMKVVWLFCLSHWYLPSMTFLVVLLVPLEIPWWVRGALNWFHNVSIYDGKVLEYWTCFSFKINLNQLKIIGEFGHTLGILGKPSMNKIKVIWEFWDLRLWKFWILNFFCHWKFNWITKHGFGRKI